MRVKWQTAVIMSAGQHSRERNFVQSLGHGSRGVVVGGGCISCLEINWFHFLSVCAEGREWEGYQRGRIPYFLSTESQSEAMARGDKKNPKIK